MPVEEKPWVKPLQVTGYRLETKACYRLQDTGEKHLHSPAQAAGFCI